MSDNQSDKSATTTARAAHDPKTERRVDAMLELAPTRPTELADLGMLTDSAQNLINGLQSICFVAEREIEDLSVEGRVVDPKTAWTALVDGLQNAIDILGPVKKFFEVAAERRVLRFNDLDCQLCTNKQSVTQDDTIVRVIADVRIAPRPGFSFIYPPEATAALCYHGSHQFPIARVETVGLHVRRLEAGERTVGENEAVRHALEQWQAAAAEELQLQAEEKAEEAAAAERKSVARAADQPTTAKRSKRIA